MENKNVLKVLFEDLGNAADEEEKEKLNEEARRVYFKDIADLGPAEKELSEIKNLILEGMKKSPLSAVIFERMENIILNSMYCGFTDGLNEGLVLGACCVGDFFKSKAKNKKSGGQKNV